MPTRERRRLVDEATGTHPMAEIETALGRIPAELAYACSTLLLEPSEKSVVQLGTTTCSRLSKFTMTSCWKLGAGVGTAVGTAVVGVNVGSSVGNTVGIYVGKVVGWDVGSNVGKAVVGANVGSPGRGVGKAVGAEVGKAVVGISVGTTEGASVTKVAEYACGDM